MAGRESQCDLWVLSSRLDLQQPIVCVSFRTLSLASVQILRRRNARLMKLALDLARTSIWNPYHLVYLCTYPHVHGTCPHVKCYCTYYVHPWYISMVYKCLSSIYSAYKCMYMVYTCMNMYIVQPCTTLQMYIHVYTMYIHLYTSHVQI